MYEKLERSKNDFLVPTVANVWLHSKYDPLKEAENFASMAIENALHDFSFAVIFGIAGGYHIASLLKKKPSLKILAIETSDEAIDFLMGVPLVSELSKNKNVIFSSVENFSSALKENYRPALDGNLTLIPLRSWKTVFSETEKMAGEIFKKTLDEISADFSVQAHFGKLWQKNIFENLKTLTSLNSAPFDGSTRLTNRRRMEQETDTKKTAAIISAGPTLDESIFDLKKNREKYVIFATDTAFSALESHGIKSDFVVSIDGQSISRRHFIKNFSSETTFVFDLCSNPASVKKAAKNGNKIIFVQTGHPLSQIASSICPQIKRIESGSGTVTIAAVSFASLLGFKDFKFFANDFAYLYGKPYAKGTYLDSIASLSSSRLFPAETAFSKIMFRAPLIPAPHASLDDKNAVTTKILLSYKESLEIFLKKNPLNPKNNLPIINEREFQDFDAKKFAWILKNLMEKGENVFLLPLAASTKSMEKAKEMTEKYIKIL